MWLESMKRELINLDHYSLVQIVPASNKVMVRAYHGMKHEFSPLAEFDTDAKAEAYFHELRLFIDKGRRVIHAKEFSPTEELSPRVARAILGLS